MEPALTSRTTPGAAIERFPDGVTRLRIPSGSNREYRLAQLDDSQGRSRAGYPWQPPLTFSLDARTSGAGLPGTWGFGFWNAPLSFSIGFGSSALLPALPDAAWFFHASIKSHLSFRNDRPGQGFLAQTFSSANLPVWALAPAAPLLPLLALAPVSRLIRRIVARWLIAEDGTELPGIDTTDWLHYEILWTPGKAAFRVDGTIILETIVTPRAPLGLVIWIDNQFATWNPAGRLRYGLEENPEEAWLEIRHADIRPG